MSIRSAFVGLWTYFLVSSLALPAMAQTPARPLSPLLERFGNSCQTILPCADMEHLGMFLGESAQVGLTDSKLGRSYVVGGDISLGFDFIRRVALEARFPVAGLFDPGQSPRLVAGPSVLGVRVRLGPPAATLYGSKKPPRYSFVLGAELGIRLPRAEGDPQAVGAMPLGTPQPRVDAAAEVNIGPAQISPSAAVLFEQGGAMLQLGLRASLRMTSAVSFDLEALSRMRAAGADEPGRCGGGARGGVGIRGVIAKGVMAFAHYSVGGGDCEPTHTAVAGLSFGFGGLPLRRIPTQEEFQASDFWQRVLMGIADPLLDCNGWMLDTESLVPLFKFGDPDPIDPMLIRRDGEVFRVGEHFDIDRKGRLYRANLLRQPLAGGQSFTDASVSQKRELPVCQQGPQHRFAEHCQALERAIEMLADAARSDGGPGWTAAMSQQWEVERECLGGKDEDERGKQISDLLRLARLLALSRPRPPVGLGVGRGAPPAGSRGAQGTAPQPRNPAQDEAAVHTEPPMFGSRGTQIPSKTLWIGPKGMHIDLENPNPGQRPGQIHFQDGKNKYYYDPATRSFMGAPRAVNDLLETPDVQRAIAKGLKFLGEQ